MDDSRTEPAWLVVVRGGYQRREWVLGWSNNGRTYTVAHAPEFRTAKDAIAWGLRRHGERAKRMEVGR